MGALKHDGIISIAEGHSRTDTNWKNRTLTWGDLVREVSVTKRTRETFAEFKKLPKETQSAIKDVGGFVGGELLSGRRTAMTVKGRQVLALDADSAPRGFDEDLALECEMTLGCAAAWYSTHNHSAEHPRLRLLIPLSRIVDAEEYQALGRKVADALNINYFDDTTYQAHRLMYWPSTSSDGEYVFGSVDLPWLNVDAWLSRYDDWRDTREWPLSDRQLSIVQRSAEKQGDPTQKPGIVGLFCRAYNVIEAIEHFIPDQYTPCGEDRYTYAGGSTAAGVVVYQNGDFVYSHHMTDPISGHLVNAFDLIRLHKYASWDEGISPDTPVSKLPSYAAMRDLASSDPRVKKLIANEQIETVKADFDDLAGQTDWESELDITASGKLKSIPLNIILILKHDPMLKDRFAFDAFACRTVVLDDLPWRPVSHGKYWSDVDDAGLRNYLSKHYDIKGQGIIFDAWREVMQQRTFHPVRDYLNAQVWDGTPRIDRLLVDYYGADDTPYTRTVTRKSLVAAVARIMRPGIKFDNTLILVGEQGIGKSTLFAKLAVRWFNDSLRTLEGKSPYELIQGSWIIEMPELAAAKKSEVETIKHFISKCEDQFRVAYERHVSYFPRQCVFFGTTNESSFLKDKTGNRRFWPVQAHYERRTRDMFEELTPDEVGQIWAEAMQLYKAGETLYLSAKEEAVAKQIQTAYMEHDPFEGYIKRYLDGVSDNDDLGTPVGLTHTCVADIWRNALGNSLNSLKQWDQKRIREIMAGLDEWEPYDDHKTNYYFKEFGSQKAWVRKGFVEVGGDLI